MSKSAYFDRVLSVADVDDLETGPVVGLIHPVALDVQVVVTGRGRPQVFANDHWIVKVGYVQDQRACALGLPHQLIEFVVQVEVSAGRQ